jgi:pimeloyl-ACP methyl ester carboxylesterase
MGGLVAQQFACDFSREVEALVIADSFSGVTTGQERFNAWLASLLLAVVPTGLQIRLLASTYKRMGHEEVAAYFEEQAARMDRRALREMRREVNAFDIFCRLGEIRAPTLVLAGDGFGAMAVAMARKTAEAIPGAAFHILAGGGDPSNLLIPEAFDREVMSFIKA